MISLVTITFNNFKELKETVDSLQTIQNNKNIQSVIINGGSCAETLKFLDNYQGKSVSEKDQGISDAFNKGVQAADGDFICFINSGDFLINSGYFDKALELLENDSELDYIYCNIIFEHQIYGDLLVTPNIGETAKMPFPHPGLIVRKSIFEQIGGFDLRLKVAMDFDFAHRLQLAQYKSFYFESEPVIRMIGDGVSSQDGIAGIKERRLILQRLGLLKAKEEKYLNNLHKKSIARKLLTKMGLIHAYDSIKNRIRKPKAE